MWLQVATYGHMKLKRKSLHEYPETGTSAKTLKEAAAAYGVRREVVSVRQAKDQLSSLLDLAEAGEEIVITSDGRPKAMIVRFRPFIHGAPWVSLKKFRDTMREGPDSTPMIREMRDSGY